MRGPRLPPEVHFTANPPTDYRSVYPGRNERKKLNMLHRGLLRRGALCATNGLFALSTPMTEDDARNVLRAVEETLDEIAGES